MILDNFTFPEICNDLKRDQQQINKLITIHLKRFHRYCKKNKVKEKYHRIKWTSSNRNNYLITYILDDHVYGFSILNYYYNSKGININKIILEGDTFLTFHYNNHFLTRYKERMLLNESINIFDLIAKFDKNNGGVNSLQSHEYLCKKEKVRDCTITLKDGIGLGVFLENHKMVVVNTFISLDKLKGDQVDDYIEKEKRISSIDKLLETIYKMAS